MDTFQMITNARDVLSLPETATMVQIKTRYRDLMKQWHPDTSSENDELCEEMSRKITDAYRVLIDYCNNYEYSFSKGDVEKHISDREWWIKQYGNDPIWG